MVNAVATPKVLCHGRKESEMLEKILVSIQNGNKIKDVTRIGSEVFVHLMDERL